MKKTLEIKDFRGSEAADLEKKVSEIEEELMRLRFRKSAGQLENSARVRTLKRQIARAKTVIREKQSSAA